jgi:hypothetical protein
MITPSKETAMPDQKAPILPAARSPAASATNPPAAAPAAFAIDERFAALAADLMSQVDAKLETFRREIAIQLGLNVDPLHKDLHDLLDMQTQAGARIEKLEAANFVTPEALQKQSEQIGDLLAEKLATKIQPTVQPVITVTDRSIEERLAKIESKFRFF